MAYEVSVANVYRINSFKKLGLVNEGELAIASLMLVNPSHWVASHLYSSFYFTISCKGLTVPTKLGTNLRTKLIFPMNDCIDFLLWGGGNFEITSALSWSIIIPSFDTTNPRSLPLVTQNIDFLGLRDMPYLRHRSKICLR